MSGNKIAIPKSILIDDSIQDIDIFTYIVIRGYCSTFEINYINTDSILYLITDQKNKRLTQGISDSINRLIQLGYIQGNKESRFYIINRVEDIDGQFTLVNPEDIITIGKDKNWAALRHYCHIMVSRNKKLLKGKISTMSIEYFSITESISKNSVINYNKKLEELGVLTIIKRGKHQNNYYCATEDSSSVLNYIDTVKLTGYN